MTLLLLEFIKKEWRYLLIFSLITGLYYIIYHHGYKSCQDDVETARRSATEEAQSIADKQANWLSDVTKQEEEKNRKLQEKLNDSLKKTKYADCVVDDNVVRLLNKRNQ